MSLAVPPSSHLVPPRVHAGQAYETTSRLPLVIPPPTGLSLSSPLGRSGTHRVPAHVGTCGCSLFSNLWCAEARVQCFPPRAAPSKQPPSLPILHFFPFQFLRICCATSPLPQQVYCVLHFGATLCSHCVAPQWAGSPGHGHHPIHPIPRRLGRPASVSGTWVPHASRALSPGYGVQEWHPGVRPRP